MSRAVLTQGQRFDFFDSLGQFVACDFRVFGFASQPLLGNNLGDVRVIENALDFVRSGTLEHQFVNQHIMCKLCGVCLAR